MKHAPPPFFAAYTDVLRSALLFAKSSMRRNTRLMDNVRLVTALLDAVSGVPEALFAWDDANETPLRKKLEYYDSRYAKAENDFSLMKVYRKHVES
ncbi:MAG: hypothetical protein JXD23_09430 [Spirochaetales bacterium]|nr:hypothetical protein [Spirochaetales bacterium]